jgi:hypothetical protein
LEKGLVDPILSILKGSAHCHTNLVELRSLQLCTTAPHLEELVFLGRAEHEANVSRGAVFGLVALARELQIVAIFCPTPHVELRHTEQGAGQPTRGVPKLM